VTVDSADRPTRIRKALTLRHPWPWAILHGKDVENRSWAPQPLELAVGEWIAIHGGNVPTDQESLEDIQEEARLLVDDGLIRLPFSPRHQEVVRPGIVAVCRFGGIVTSSRSPWFEGPKGWLLDRTLALPTRIPWPGARGLWVVPAELERRVLTALSDVAVQGRLFDVAETGLGSYGGGA
jgi:hypothetical protein